MTPVEIQWALVSLSPLSFILKAAVSFALGLAVLAMAKQHFKQKKERKIWVLRTLIAVLLFFMMIEPALQRREVRRVPDRVAVVIDDSASMALASTPSMSRYEQVLAFLSSEKETLEDLGDEHILEWYAVDGRKLDAQQLPTAAVSEDTDLNHALSAAYSGSSRLPLAGIILLSDGADRHGIADEKGALQRQIFERVQKENVPIHSFSHNDKPFVDTAIADVVSEEFAFVENTISIDVLVSHTGAEGMSANLTLFENEQPISSQSIIFDAPKLTQSFEIKPQEIGEFLYRVELSPQPDELLAQNNQKNFGVKVVRDKIRVLQVAGRPSWDERFLRQHLKENPNVDLVSFFILRTNNDERRAPQNELSLIPFPTDQLFTTELSSFDVVVFQNFDYRPYNMAQYLPNINKAVREDGLGFIMIGGNQSFEAGGYSGTIIEDLIPMGLGEANYSAQSIRLKITADGARHPVTALTRGLRSNTSIWKDLPKISGLNRLSPTVPGAQILVYAEANGLPKLPLLAAMQVEKGRTMAIASDGLWRLRFSKAEDGGASERAYHRFWSNTLRWLVQDPEHSRLKLSAKVRREGNGQNKVIVQGQILDEAYRPAAQKQLRLRIGGGLGTAPKLFDLVSDGDGKFSEVLENLPAGAYQVSGTAFSKKKQSASATAVFVIPETTAELERPGPRPDILKALSDASGGEHRSGRDARSFEGLNFLEQDIVDIDRVENIELWDNAAALLLLCALLAIEWFVRRRLGYV